MRQAVAKPELQRRLSASLPPFDGTTIAVCDDPTVDEVLEMLQFISGQLATQNGDLFLFDDWHEHDGFLTEPKPTDWQTTIGAWPDIQSLHASCHGDDYVRIALYSPSFHWLLRYDLDSSDSTAIEDAWPVLDYTAAANTEASQLIAAVAERWPGSTNVSPAAQHFQSCYAG